MHKASYKINYKRNVTSKGKEPTQNQGQKQQIQTYFMLPDLQPSLPGIKAIVLAPVPSLPLAVGPDFLIDPSCFDLPLNSLLPSTPALMTQLRMVVTRTCDKPGPKYPFNKQRIIIAKECRKTFRTFLCNWTPLSFEMTTSLRSRILYKYG